MRVALLTVGDELLAGDTVNTNAAWLGRRLAERGVDVERVLVLPDRVGEIARAVNEAQAAFDAVVVTGGLGPTHDDLTMEAVAAAFGTELSTSRAVRDWLDEKGYAADDLAPGTTRIPARAEMLPNPEGVAPGCHIGNVYVLPGVPAEMKAMWGEIAAEFSGEARYVETVRAAEPESALVGRIAELRDRFDVVVGSYPGEDVRIKIQATDEEELRRAVDWLRERVESPAPD